MLAKCEFHCHSKEDPWDNQIGHSAEELVGRAKVLGFDFVALTHHTKIHFPETLKDAAEKAGILMVPSCELCVEGNDLLVINAPENAEGILTKWDGIRDFKKNFPEALIIAPHPHHVAAGSMGHRRLKALADSWDAVEICHFYTSMINPTRRTERFARRNHIPLIATSDAHSLKGFGQNFTLVETEGETMDWPQLAEAVRKGNTLPVHAPIPWGAFARKLGHILKETWRHRHGNPRKQPQKHCPKKGKNG